MRFISRRTLIFLQTVLLLLIVNYCRAMMKDVKKKSSRKFALKLQEYYGIASGGSLNAEYSITPASAEADFKSFAVLLLVNENAYVGWYEQVLKANGEDGQLYMDWLCNSPSQMRVKLSGTGGTHQYTISETSRFSVILLQCAEGIESNPVTVTMKLRLRNPTPTGDVVAELPIDEIGYIHLTLGLLIMYIILSLVLTGQMLRSRDNSLKTIHYLFLGTLIIGIVANTSEYAFLNSLNASGKTNYTFMTFVRIMSHLFNTSFLASLLLLSLGWTISRNFLPEKERHFVLISLSSFFVTGLVAASCVDVDASFGCKAMSVLSYIMRSIILLGMVIGMNFTITQLRTILMHLPWVPTVLVQYAREKQFNIFRIAFLFYLILPTVILIVQLTILSWRTMWISELFLELLDIFLICIVGANFFPMSEPILSRAFDGSIEARVD